jgi:threonine dehydratase
MKEDISLSEFLIAEKKIKDLINHTSLDNYRDNIYLKRESLQKTGSFKWRGVLYATMCEFDKLLDLQPTSDYYIVTQSTGNHGIATLESVYTCINYYTKLYPKLKDIWYNIHPVIFTNKSVTNKKLEKMKSYLDKFKWYHKGFIDELSQNYEESVDKRIKFLKNHNGVYLEHGGKNIMTGYGSIALEIHRKIPIHKSISLFVTVGAGGPIGIGLCLKKLRNTEFNIVQTEDFDAFIRSLESGKIEKNKNNSIVSISDGIAVDQPEIFSLLIAKKIVNNNYKVSNKEVYDLIERNNLGNSTNITLAGMYKSNIKTDYIIILDCEGNSN